LSSSFLVPTSCTPRRYLSIKHNSASRDDGSDRVNNTFNENAILGETLDVDLHDGIYTWSNSKDNLSDDIRSNRRSSKSSSVYSAPDEVHYKRIPFDGCGSILLHQQRDSFLKPTSSKESDSGTRKSRRQQGRTGVTLWSASYVISYYIDAKWSTGGSWCCNERGTNFESRWTVLELGAGLGLCSAVAAKHGMNVVSTDNDPAVLSLLGENLERNTINDVLATRPTEQQVHVHSLDWVDVANDPDAERSHPVFLELESLGGADVILLSDVVYGATQPAWDALLVLVNKFCAQQQRLRVGPVNCDENNATKLKKGAQYERPANPVVLLGYTQRRRDMSPQDEARFFAMVRGAGMEAVLIPLTSIPNCEKYMLTSLFELRLIEA